jgi:hypothetical protein
MGIRGELGKSVDAALALPLGRRVWQRHVGLLKGRFLVGVEDNVPWSIGLCANAGDGPVGGVDVIDKDTW